MVLSLLLNLSVSFMKAHHFKESVKCLNEAINMTNISPEVYHRKSQAICYNLFSSIEELIEAKKCIEIAIQMKPDEIKYMAFVEIIEKRIHEKIIEEKSMTEALLNTPIKMEIKKTETNVKEKPIEYKILRKYIFWMLNNLE